MQRQETRILIDPVTKLRNLDTLPFNRQQKENAKKVHPLYGKVPLEVHHINPHYRSHDNSDANARAVTRPEHALDHIKLATEASDWSEARVNYWAVQQIVRRMSPPELNEFNQRLVKK